MEAFYANSTRTYDERGVECGDSWFDLVECLANVFENEIDQMAAHRLDKKYWPRVA